MSCRYYRGVVLCGPKASEVRPYKGKRPVSKYCFECRRRVVHDWILVDQPYYDPEIFPRCRGCGHDHTNFPGTWKE